MRLDAPNSEMSSAAVEQQKEVDDYFRSSAAYWKNIYEDNRLLPVIYRERRASALRWVDELGLAADARVLEVGCGAGVTTVALAQRGYAVQALDSTEAMIGLTRREAEAAGVAGRVAARIGDAHNLDFAPRSFDLVVALGVIPWLHSPGQAAAEMARVLRPGGYLIVTADNRARLNWLLDPRCTPVLAPLRLAIKRLLCLLRLWKDRGETLDVKKHYPGEVDRLIGTAGLRKIKSKTVGFGPFSLFGIGLLPESAGVKLHRSLQPLADRGVAGLRSTGSHYLLLAGKPAEKEQDADERR